MEVSEELKETHILLVDDDQTLLKFFKIHLNKFFSRVVVVNGSKEAMTALNERNIDFVITDLRMPREDGLQLMKRIRQKDPSIPVFIISGAALNPKQNDTIFNKADGFLMKPFELDALHRFIMAGIRTRTIYRTIFEIIPDRTKFLNLIHEGRFPLTLNDDERIIVKEGVTELLSLNPHLKVIQTKILNSRKTKAQKRRRLISKAISSKKKVNKKILKKVKKKTTSVKKKTQKKSVPKKVEVTKGQVIKLKSYKKKQHKVKTKRSTYL